MQTGSDNMAVQEFQDRIWTLEEYKHEVGVSSRTDVVEHPDTAEVLSEMETMVVECPEIAQFYAGALKRYKEGKPETVADELEVISERIALMESEGLFTEKRAAELKEQIKTGEIVKNEAETFFNMFKRVVPAELLPRRERKTRAVRAVRGPNQARSIDMVITEHGGVRINGKFLRALTPVQKLIIFSGLAKGEGFRHFEIYGSDEFAQVAGKGTREEQAEKYTAEWDALQEFLRQNRFSRLVDDKRKPGEKRHIIAAHSVDDQRRVQSQRSTASSSAVRQRRRFYEESDRAEVHSFGRPRSEVNETAFEASLLEQASTMVLDRVLSSSVPVRRNDIIGEVARRFELDPNVARRLVTTIYQRERQSETPRIQQQRLSGGKYFGRPSQHEVADEKVSPYGPYFVTVHLQNLQLAMAA